MSAPELLVGFNHAAHSNWKLTITTESEKDKPRKERKSVSKLSKKSSALEQDGITLHVNSIVLGRQSVFFRFTLFSACFCFYFVTFVLSKKIFPQMGLLSLADRKWRVGPEEKTNICRWQ